MTEHEEIAEKYGQCSLPSLCVTLLFVVLLVDKTLAFGSENQFASAMMMAITARVVIWVTGWSYLLAC